MASPAPPKALLDACVLYPPLVRSLLLGAAEAGLITLFWSPRILDEWQIAVARKIGPDAEASVLETRTAMKARFPGAEVTPIPDADSELDLPDAADIHVVEAARAAGAELIVTFNLRDFPTHRLAPIGLTAQHPDSLLWSLLDPSGGPMTDVVRQSLAQIDVADDAPATRARAVLKRARLPRLGKAWAGLVAE